MKTINEILENYENEYEVDFQDRFGIRFVDFLTEEQGKKIGFVVQEGATWHSPKGWTRENILSQLKEDVEFGYEKACDERGLSANLMFEVVRIWNKILEEGLENWNKFNYEPYGKPLFEATAEKYGWELESW